MRHVLTNVTGISVFDLAINSLGLGLSDACLSFQENLYFNITFAIAGWWTNVCSAPQMAWALTFQAALPQMSPEVVVSSASSF